MKVLIINTYHYLRGGDSRLVFETARALECWGAEVHHFAMQGANNLPCRDAAYFIREIDYQRALSNRSLPLVLRALSSSVFSLEAKRRLSDLLDVCRPDIVHLHSIRHHLTKSILIELKKQRLPVVWTLHDFKEICPNTSLYNRFGICERCKGGRFRNVVRLRCKKGSLAASMLTYIEAQVNSRSFFDRRVDRYISPSLFLKRKFIEFGYNPERIVHLPNFIDADAFSPGYDGEPYLLYFGRIERIKGIHTLIEACRLSRISHYGWRLVIAGVGQAMESLKRLTKTISDLTVEWVGYQKGQSLEDLVRCAGAVVVPSEWYENYPYAILEAMAYGKLVVGANIGGISEQIEDGCTGFLFESGNARQLAERIERVIQLPPETRREMGRSARLKIERENGKTAHVESLTSLYGELLYR